MKKLALAAALTLMTGALFAQTAGGMMGPGRGGPGFGPEAQWSIGTVITTEYKKVSGKISIGQTLAPMFKADGIDYQIWLPRNSELASLKNGDTITVEGTYTTVKSDADVSPSVRPFKVTVNGKEIDLTNLMGGRAGRMGDRDWNNGPRK